MMIRTLLLFLLISQSVFAGLTLWTPVGYDHTFLLPENVTPEQFLQFAKAHPRNSRYVKELSFSAQDQVRIVSKLRGSRDEKSLLIANAPSDHNQEQIRVRTFSKHLVHSYILPVGAAYQLNLIERKKFYSDIYKNIKLLVPMGGDDVTPEMYNEKVNGAVGFDPFRDRLEIELIQFFNSFSEDSGQSKKSKNSVEMTGKIFGICRGMQITCVALGGKLHQDLIQDLGVQEDHKDGAFHEIYLTGPKGHPGTQFLSSFSDWKGNSWHHQALDKNSLSNTPLTVIAESIEGVVEASASADNRILLLQSHPEKSDPKTGQAERFFDQLKVWVAEPVQVNCRRVLKSSH
jgi:gamma-glutamyl-gamma-aminobutyrate hydrolase PuuD